MTWLATFEFQVGLRQQGLGVRDKEEARLGVYGVDGLPANK